MDREKSFPYVVTEDHMFLEHFRSFAYVFIALQLAPIVHSPLEPTFASLTIILGQSEIIKCFCTNCGKVKGQKPQRTEERPGPHTTRTFRWILSWLAETIGCCGLKADKSQ